MRALFTGLSWFLRFFEVISVNGTSPTQTNGAPQKCETAQWTDLWLCRWPRRASDESFCYAFAFKARRFRKLLADEPRSIMLYQRTHVGPTLLNLLVRPLDLLYQMFYSAFSFELWDSRAPPQDDPSKYYAVRCETCKADVGLLDMDGIFHLFHVLESLA